MKTDREKLSELFVKWFNTPLPDGTFSAEKMGESIADDLIKHGATIPVRCKDCKYYGITGDQSCEVHSSTMLEDDYHIVTMEPDDFCSYGEREEE